jgi:hypothetical protein
MRTPVPARSWPFPARPPNVKAIEQAQWDELVTTAGLEPPSEDGRALVAKVRDLLATLRVTLDGRLVSEAVPRAAEISDPLAQLAIPGALALMKYFADMDAVSMEHLLGDSWEVAERALGFPAATPRQGRVTTLLNLSTALQVMLPAMVHRASVADRERAPGRPPSSRDESAQVVIELHTIWAEHGDGDENDFLAFVRYCFALAGVKAPSRELVRESRSALPDLAQQDEAQLALLRKRARSERKKIAARCEEPANLRRIISFAAQNGRLAARALGCDDDGPLAAWRAEVQRTRDPSAPESAPVPTSARSSSGRQLGADSKPPRGKTGSKRRAGRGAT